MRHEVPQIKSMYKAWQDSATLLLYFRGIIGKRDVQSKNKAQSKYQAREMGANAKAKVNVTGRLCIVEWLTYLNEQLIKISKIYELPKNCSSL